MPIDADYELMPHRTIVELKHELKVLKKKAYSKEKPSKDVQDSMNKLSNNINKLMELFTVAAQDMQEEESEPEMHKQLAPLMNRINEVEGENRKIAEGILVVADMINDLQDGEKKIEAKLGGNVPAMKPAGMLKTQLPKGPVQSRPMGNPMQYTQPKLKVAPGQSIPKGMPTPSLNTAPKPGVNHTMVQGMPQAPRPQVKSMAPPGQISGRPTMSASNPIGMPPNQMSGMSMGAKQGGLQPMGGPMPPPRSMSPSELPPLPEIQAGPKKEGFFSKLFKKK